MASDDDLEALRAEREALRAEKADYRRAAILLACQRSAQAYRYILRCSDRCGAQITCRQRDTILHYGPRELAQRALDAGWGIDTTGHPYCPACHEARKQAQS